MANDAVPPVKGEISEVSIEAVIIRADGTREDVGVISYWNKNPVKRLVHKIKRATKGAKG